MEKSTFIYNEEFVKNYDEDSDKGYILEVDVYCLENLCDLRTDFPFLLKTIEINKCEKPVCRFY